MGWESFDVLRFDLGPLLQGQTRIPKLRSAYSSVASEEANKTKAFITMLGVY